MPITRFDKPTQSKYTSQFVEEKYPYEAIQQAGQMMQQKISGVRQAAGELESKLSIDSTPEIPSVYRQAKAREAQYQQRIDDVVSEFQKTGNINKTARRIQQLNAEWQQDPIKNNAERITQTWRQAKEEEQRMARKGDPYFNVMRQLQRQGQLGLDTMLEGPAVRKGAPGTAAQDFVRDITKDIEPQEIEDKKGVTREKLLRQRVRNVAGVDEKGSEIVDPGKGFESFVGSYSREQLRELQDRTGKNPQQLYLDAVNQRADEMRQYDVSRESGRGGGGVEATQLSPQFSQPLEGYPVIGSGVEYNFGDEQRTIPSMAVNNPIEINAAENKKVGEHERKTYENVDFEGVIVDEEGNKYARLVDRLRGDIKKKDGDPVYNTSFLGQGTKDELVEKAKPMFSGEDNPEEKARQHVENNIISGLEPMREESAVTDIIVPVNENQNPTLKKYFNLPEGTTNWGW